MPDASGRICDFEADESNAINSCSRFDLVDRCAGPGHDRRLHSHRGPHGTKRKRTASTSRTELTVGDIVVLVALSRISLAPSVFMWSDILAFTEVGRAWIRCWNQVTHCHRNAVRGPGMGVARVVVWGCGRVSPRIGAGKGI